MFSFTKHTFIYISDSAMVNQKLAGLILGLSAAKFPMNGLRCQSEYLESEDQNRGLAGAHDRTKINVILDIFSVLDNIYRA